jgi:hypothetical protein
MKLNVTHQDPAEPGSNDAAQPTEAAGAWRALPEHESSPID